MLPTSVPETPNVALLVEGVVTADAPAEGPAETALSLAPALVQSTGWSVRLAAPTDAEHLPTRIGLKHAVRRALAEVTGRLVLALTVEAVGAGGTNGGPALVTDDDWAAFPEDATLELAWLRSELRDLEARLLIVAVEVVGGDAHLPAVF